MRPFLLALLVCCGCDGWHGLKSDGAGTSSGGGVVTNSGLLGFACGSDLVCGDGLMCDTSMPGGLCTRSCQSNADCSGGVCVVEVGLMCLPSCANGQTCRVGYTCSSSTSGSVCAPGGSSPTGGASDAGLD